jgi:hypothetical protein
MKRHGGKRLDTRSQSVIYSGGKAIGCMLVCLLDTLHTS